MLPSIILTTALALAVSALPQGCVRKCCVHVLSANKAPNGVVGLLSIVVQDLSVVVRLDCLFPVLSFPILPMIYFLVLPLT